MIVLDYKDRRPLYEQVAERFKELIIRGVLPADTQMPSVRSQAIALSINPNTIQRAYSQLEQQGYIYPVKGRGNFVADSTALVKQKKESLLEEMKRLVTGGKELGIRQTEFIRVIDLVYREEDSHD